MMGKNLADATLDYAAKLQHLLRLSRQDLCFAIQHMDGCDIYNSRLFGTVIGITKALNDKEDFKKYMEKQGMSCPDCHFHSHRRKCELHGI